jgi:bifunctional ADP-heptose synthase (sugar kinase/adenylyltransferase)
MYTPSERREESRRGTQECVRHGFSYVMDTRNKILSADAAPRGATVVTGTFDVIRAEDARELEAIRRRTGGPLVAIVLPLEDALLPQRARAELVAALRMVDYVLITDDGHPDALLASLQPSQVVRLEAVHADRKRQLMEHVHRRQTS